MFGFEIERQPFECIDWIRGAASFTLNGEQFQVQVGPFTLGCQAQAPLAVLTATGRNPETAGAVYPFPMIEDGDFDIPSAYMTEEEGARLASHADKLAALVIEAERHPSSGFKMRGVSGVYTLSF